ncbi:MAG: N(4)-(beta-N-acetylglucosaminyl)-L-asparaginase [Phycisphaerae bacterium]
MSITRREFVQAAGLAATGVTGARAMGQTSDGGAARQGAPAAAPAFQAAGKAMIIASVNGKSASDKTMELLRSGADVLDAIVAGVNLVENDEKDHSVGLGGLPNEDGVVELDAAVMHGAKHKAGAVASLQRIKNPSSVAKLVMERTDHVLIVGAGALRFAKAHGFKEEELLTDEARAIWLKWKESHSDDDDWLRPEADQEAARLRPRVEGRDFTHGTVHMSAMSAAGDLASCTSTSGLSWKIPGRVGDSPIIGAGLFCDNAVGAAGSTGRGEANLQNCTSFLVVELMRGGMTPNEACLAALGRIAGRCEKRLRNERGEPAFDLKLYALRKDGLVGGASMRGKAKMAVHDGVASQEIELPALYSA